MAKFYKYNNTDNKIIKYGILHNNEISYLPENIKSKLKKKDRQLLFQYNKFKNVNTYVIKDTFIIFKVYGIRSVLSNNEIWFIIPNDSEYDMQLYNDIEKLSIDYLEQFNSNFVLSILEFIIDILIREGENRVAKFNDSLNCFINKKYKNSMDKFKDIYFVNIQTNESYELYSDIIELLQYLLENEDDINGFIKLIGNDLEEDILNNYNEEIENILENGINIMKDIINEFHNITNKIDNYKNITEIQLDSIRNNIAILTVNIEYITLIFSGGAFISSVFGMNLSNEIEEVEGGAYIILSIIFFFMFIGFYFYINRYKNYIGLNTDSNYMLRE